MWLPGADRAPTAAKGGYGVADGEMVPTATVWHVMQGHLSTMRLWAAERPAHHEASYHFGLGLNGDVVQFVPIFTPAWHAGRLDNVYPTWPGYRPDMNPGGHTIGVAAEGFHDSSDVWNPVQLAAAVDIQRWIGDQTGMAPTVETVIGHREIAPVSRANDPGSKWPQLWLIQNATAGLLPPKLNLKRPRWATYARALMRMGGNRVTPLRREARDDVYELRYRR